MTGDFPLTTEFLQQAVGDRVAISGAQVHVRVRGTHVFAAAMGNAGTHPTTNDTVFRVYCAIKPITSVAIAKLVDARLLDLEEPLSSLLPSVRALAADRINLRHVMSHTAGLHLPSGREVELVPPEKRRELYEQAPGVQGWLIGHDAAYSEAFAWHLLGRSIEVVTGEPLRDHLRASVLDPLEMTSTWIGMTEAEYAANYDRIGLNYYYQHRRGQPVPLLIERAERWCCETNCALGGYTTARDLTRFYAALSARLNGADDARLPAPETLALFCSNARVASYDAVLERECAFGLGFMTSLDGHCFGSACSERAFAHSGWLGAAFAFADPAHGLAAAVIFNSIVATEAAFTRRPALVTALYEDLGLAPARSAGSATQGERARHPERDERLAAYVARRRQRRDGRRGGPRRWWGRGR